MFQTCCLHFQLPWRDTNLEDELNLLQSIVKTIRSIRQEYNVTRAKPEGITVLLLFFFFCLFFISVLLIWECHKMLSNLNVGI